MQMNDRVRDWIAALRSGGYQQTKSGCMYNTEEGGFCCLGVAHGAVFDGQFTALAGQPWGKRAVRGDGYVSLMYLPSSEMEALGLGLADQDLLTVLNDGDCTSGLSFPEIADVVEAAALRGLSVWYAWHAICVAVHGEGVVA